MKYHHRLGVICEYQHICSIKRAQSATTVFQMCHSGSVKALKLCGAATLQDMLCQLGATAESLINPDHDYNSDGSVLHVYICVL